MKQKIKKYLKPIVAPILIGLVRGYLYLFYAILKRKDIFDVTGFLKIPHVPLKLINQSHITFGIKSVIKKKYGKLIKWDTEIEHGITIGKDRVNYSYYAKNVITMSNARATLLSENHHATAIGPYIAYAENIYPNRRLVKSKEALGKVLLAFPSHSTPTEAVSFNELSFVENINKIKQNYDTIIVCLYWVDFMRDSGSYYIEKGFRVVCAGHRYDPFFLSRLRTIITLADHCMTNNVGTHIGYCVYLNKPVMYFEQSINYEGLESDWNNKVKLNTCEGTFEEYMSERKAVEQCFKLVFDDQPIITLEKMSLVEFYWGLSQVRL
jgi:hypothetical protein